MKIEIPRQVIRPYWYRVLVFPKTWWLLVVCLKRLNEKRPYWVAMKLGSVTLKPNRRAS